MNRKAILFSIVSVSVLLRIAAALYLGDSVEALPGIADQVSYHSLAERVLNGFGFTFDRNWWPATRAGEPTAHWSFLYTFYLAGIYALFGIHPVAARLVQVVIVGVLQPILCYWIAQRLFNRLSGLIAAAINAVYFYYIYYDAALMTEPYFITAILASLYLSIVLVDQMTGKSPQTSRSQILFKSLLLGLALSVAILLRQLFMLIIPFIFGWMWWAIRYKRGTSILPSLLIPCVVIMIAILPFSLYNYSRFHHFVLLNTNAGYAFFWANHPIHGTSFLPAQDIQDYRGLIPAELLSLDEAAMEKALLKAGLGFIGEDPGRYLLLSLSRIKSYFMFWPLESSSLLSNIARVGSFGLFLPFMVLGIILWLRDMVHYGIKGMFASPGMLIFAYMVTYTGLHLLSWALVRYRLPVDAGLQIFASYAFVKIVEPLANKRRRQVVDGPLYG